MKKIDKVRFSFSVLKSKMESIEILDRTCSPSPRPKKRLLVKWFNAAKEWASTTSFHGKFFIYQRLFIN